MKTELVVNGAPMMGTKEIAKMTEKRPADVIRDVWVMLESLYGISKDNANLRNYKNQQVALVSGVIACIDNRGFVSEFLLDRRHSEILVSGYDVKRRAAIIDRWHALETGESQPRLSPPAPQETHMNNDILSLARVVAEATASATMKAVIDIVGVQKYQPVTESVTAITPPAPETLQINHQASTSEESEYALVSELSWVSGLSDSTCRRLVTFANLPTRRTNGDRGHLQINRESFMRAAQALLDESTPPTGKLKRWQHPEFNGFTLRLKSESHTGEAK
ncbi:Rha family transcriptional regulator [Yersinia enterocolitica]|uniref:Transcriptional regulator n=1 Tax=Yersinia intermedia TaxID=631 RepID=A0ABX6FEK2_YERIN|nr:Rha family transcriptional regulator [Yersinia intermedia]EKN4075472.1 Rha family transcriptional regulator [Yersinia enterocolitica]EKN4145227.1 Rha family transcriptional regulator [Yersinia enterocolitica]EME3602949.1 Rha family transcriptional regulator [Yersinia enterocolitica]QGR67097.1 transcriptional regulator [Yersinia intermedia]QGR72113.1 transcriptional regulator [Yersinia intermedia]